METGDYIALGALALGLFNFWFGVVRPWWRGRYATPMAVFEILHVAGSRGPEAKERIVLTNLGPGAMRDVDVRMRDPNGGDPTEAYLVLGPQLPVPIIHAKQSLHFGSVRALGQRAPAAVIISWRDGRRRRQESEIWVSAHDVT